METQRDFEELLKLLNARNVDFVIVGGYALAFHGAPRYTGDLDVFVKPDESNAARVLKALDDFGFGFINLTIGDFSRPGKVVQLGHPPVRIDLITSITGVPWEDASAHSVPAMYGEVSVRYLGKKELIANKRAVGRHKDLADIEALGEKA